MGAGNFTPSDLVNEKALAISIHISPVYSDWPGEQLLTIYNAGNISTSVAKKSYSWTITIICPRLSMYVSRHAEMHLYADVSALWMLPYTELSVTYIGLSAPAPEASRRPSKFRQH